MANWSDLKSAVASIVKTNGNKEITGQLLQNVLNNIISNVGANSSFAGIATPETNPGTPDGNVFYLATKEGTYSNFNGIVINSGEAVILEWKGSWVKKSSGFATQKHFEGLDLSSRNRLTNLFNCTMSADFDTTNGTVHMKLLGQTVQSTRYIYHERGYYGISSDISKVITYNTIGLNFICYDDSSKDIVLYSALKEVPLSAVILEIFYSYQKSISAFAWTSNLITKTGTSLHKKAACFQTAAIEDNILELDNNLKAKSERIDNTFAGFEYEKSFDTIAHSYKIDFEAQKGSTVEVSYNSDSPITCAIGVTTKDGKNIDNIATLYSPGQLGKIVLTSSDIKAIRAYVIEDSSSYNSFSLKAHVEGIYNVIEKLHSRPKATGALNCSVNLTVENKQIVVEIINELASAYGYLYHEYGYKPITSSLSNTIDLLNGLNYIYYDSINKAVCNSNNIDLLPTDAILLEAFYCYNSKIVKVFWTSPFITKKGYRIENANCSFSNPADIANINSAVIGSEIVSKFIDTTGARTIYLAAPSKAGTKLDISFDSNAQIRCALGVDFYDGTQHYNIATLNNNEHCIYIAEKDVKDIALYIFDAGTFNITVTAKIVGLKDDIENAQQKINQIEELLEGFKKEPIIKPMSAKILQRVGCIGDSYTAGYIKKGEYFSNGSENNAWPHYMEGLTNNKYDNWGVSGSTCKSWMISTLSNLDKVKLEGNKCQAYVIGLMINDRTQADWNKYYTPVGTKEDIGTDSETYYAYYYKLIQEVVNVNPLAKIFCNTCPKWSETDSYNQAVRDIVSHCKANGQNVYLCDLASAKYSSYYKNEVFAKDYINGHYTSIGYEYMAECYLHVLSDVINSNISDFQNIAFVPFDE